MKVKELLKVLKSTEEITFYLETSNEELIELEIINGADYDNLINQQYYVSVDYEASEDDETNEYNLKADYIINFDQFNECEVVELNAYSFWLELTIRL